MTPAQVAAIPKELRTRRQWVTWRLEKRRGKLTKVPYDPKTDRGASTADPATWASFEEAQKAFRGGGYDGLGFVFTESDPFTGIDLDGCISDDGSVKEWALEIVRRLDSFTELSPSGRGLHIFVRAVLPAGGRRKGQIEMYDCGRYFTVTGRKFEWQR